MIIIASIIAFALGFFLRGWIERRLDEISNLGGDGRS